MAQNEIRPGPHTAFFYGTLMAREVLDRVCHGTSKPTEAKQKAFTIVPAILHNHCRHRVKYADYPGMIAQAGHSVRGTYVTGLTDTDVLRLDVFEGGEYVKRDVRVRLLRGTGPFEEKGEARTTTYIFIGGDDRLEKREWDYEEFRTEKMKGRWSDDSSEYEEADKAGKDELDTTDTTGGRAIGGEKDKLLNSTKDEKDKLLNSIKDEKDKLFSSTKDEKDKLFNSAKDEKEVLESAV